MYSKWNNDKVKSINEMSLTVYDKKISSLTSKLSSKMKKTQNTVLKLDSMGHKEASSKDVPKNLIMLNFYLEKVHIQILH